jgi:hypothetical protein
MEAMASYQKFVIEKSGVEIGGKFLGAKGPSDFNFLRVIKFQNNVD